MESSAGSISKRIVITVRGRVQGVGFRPFVYREAKRCGIKGYVTNTAEGVYIDAEGENLDDFTAALRCAYPDRARMDFVEITDADPLGYADFEIRESIEGPGTAVIPLDTALCRACEAEMDDPANRRYRYPFINCTDCGPRYTIIQTPPYDRVRTSMKKFVMCPECTAEYSDPESRRYHAEPISCPKCGPQLQFFDKNGEVITGNPIESAARMLHEGKIIALKGLGGFHLMCDATSDAAVEKLRLRKRRPGKPLAVMFASLERIRECAAVDEEEAAWIEGEIKPIVILRSLSNTILSPRVAPLIRRIGAFLPYTPLHRLLFEHIDFPLVATSANRSEEPIIIRQEEIVALLGDVVDGILDHNRTIVNALDDTVIQVVEGRKVTLRMGRGAAPWSLSLEKPIDIPTLSVGAHQKSAVAVAAEKTVLLGGHIGDLGSLEADGYFERTIKTLKRFYDFIPRRLIGDLHPHYSSSRYVVSATVKEKVFIQHHYAHILACMAEYGLREKVVGFAYDGTGYGEDGRIWGGEVMIADLHGYERIYTLKPFALIGGERAIKEPRRIGLSLLFERFTLDEVLCLNSPCAEAFMSHEIRQMHHMWQKGINSPMSSSMGRLFDAVASLGGFIQTLDYEGQGGLVMESYVEDRPYTPFGFALREGEIDVTEMIGEIIDIEHNTVDKEAAKKEIAGRFISTVAAIIVKIADGYPALKVVIGGGVFQNREVIRMLIHGFGDREFYAQCDTPINDGSIALGQVWWGIHNGCGD
ncbi:MAG: carbamoyltransferase HypF [Sulfuricurvum sp.]|jgi:hydrogenase maturation protein HypF|uniref:carbamoyltransferase HypF n=1 Tax=Sulfuricurvum sp. TaxID=2025608 RepID=UPI0025F3293B|nr:carbamoyltransferase HypF [Sulfuricurvum sp.]MCK9373745.1 carbamoyltransferase HypF [Sulfuricurvum sp.]